MRRSLGGISSARGRRKRIELREGPALKSLERLAAEGQRFDFCFIDADKVNNPQYLDWALKLTHQGSLLVFDNVVRDGEILEAESRDPAVQGTRRLHERLAEDPRVSATAIQTVGAKGYDGFALALVLADPVAPGAIEMAIYHLSVKCMSRSRGQSATAAAAYRSAEKIRDERTGEIHDYGRKGGVLHRELVLPQDSPAWARAA